MRIEQQLLEQRLGLLASNRSVGARCYAATGSGAMSVVG